MVTHFSFDIYSLQLLHLKTEIVERGLKISIYRIAWSSLVLLSLSPRLREFLKFLGDSYQTNNTKIGLDEFKFDLVKLACNG